MIRKTLNATKAATYLIELPNAQDGIMPTPTGTGFFVSDNGWFVTAAHVITENVHPNGPVRSDIDKCWLTKEAPSGLAGMRMCQFVSFSFIDPLTDFALLKVDFQANSTKEHLVGLTGFPFIQMSSRTLDEGEPVYAFGYPLSNAIMLVNTPNLKMGHSEISPRTTSAIVSSLMDVSKHFSSSNDPRVYVLDKALNYGNSGGPILSSETGHVHALCSRFQPVTVWQQHFTPPVPILIPSLYGVVSRLNNPSILEQLAKRNVRIVCT